MNPSCRLHHLHHLLCGASAAWLVLTIPAFSQAEDLEALVKGSRVAMKANHWEQALDFNTRAVERFGRHDPLRFYGAQFGAVFYHKGVCEMKLKKWPEAMLSFEICYRDFPNAGADRGNPFQKMALLKWGEAAMGAGNRELAISRFTKFIEERDKTRDKFPQGAFYIDLAVCQYRSGRIAEGNENLEIAIRNKQDFPTPAVGIVAGFQALVGAVIAGRNEQALLDFIGKNRGELVSEPAQMRSDSGVFLKLAGDALAAGMQRAALAIYPFVPIAEDAAADSPAIVTLAGLALIHEQNGNVRGAFAAYEQLELYHPAAANREDSLYQLIRTSSIIGENDLARLYARRLLKDFPQSTHLDELRAAGIGFAETEAAGVPCPATEVAAAAAPGKPLPKTREFRVAIALYQGRKYQEAQLAFGKLAARDGSEFAAFYQMECLRKLGDLDGLAAALGSFVKTPSLGGDRLRQLEIDVLWDAVRTKSWDRLAQSAHERLHQRLPGDQRAQVAYCHALALENLGRPTEALNAYNVALTADAGASEEIARQAILHALRIHQADPEVRDAIAKWGTPEESRASTGFIRLREAAALAVLFELSLGAGTPLPCDFKDFLKYKSAA